MMYDAQARRDQLYQWMQANGVTEPANTIVDNVEVRDGIIYYQVVKLGDGSNRWMQSKQVPVTKPKTHRSTHTDD